MYFTTGEKDAAKSVILSVLFDVAIAASSKASVAAAESDQSSTSSLLAAATLADT